MQVVCKSAIHFDHTTILPWRQEVVEVEEDAEKRIRRATCVEFRRNEMNDSPDNTKYTKYTKYDTEYVVENRKWPLQNSCSFVSTDPLALGPFAQPRDGKEPGRSQGQRHQFALFQVSPFRLF